MPHRKQVSPYYLAIKNYVHNELKLTKQDIYDVVTEAVYSVIDKKLNNKLGLENYIDDQIARSISNQLNSRGLTRVATEEIKQIIRDKFDIDVTIKINEKVAP